MNPPQTQSPGAEEFHIGITMAGAASAGCYTAGVMDYLFEILDLWEKAKNKNLPEKWGNALYPYIPQHKVIIDAMGGTSAGGMTTIMAAIYALRGIVNPVHSTNEKDQKKDNIFYDSWVLMGDNDNNSTKLFEKTLDTSDLAATGKIESLLNSGFIDRICEEAFSNAPEKNNIPGYISPGLEVVLSHTMLRSIPLAVSFTTPVGALRPGNNNPVHHTFDHFTVSHFKLDYNEQEHRDRFLPLNPRGKDAHTMMLATKATGAFPIGLRFREFFQNEFSAAYLKHITGKVILGGSDKTSVHLEKMQMDWSGGVPTPFRFVSIDGGAINNEPFGEVLNILKERHGIKQPGEDHRYGLIMIDPFPDKLANTPKEDPHDLFTVIPAIIGTLWDQAKVKRAETLDAFTNDYYRGEIFPSRHVYNEQTKKYEHQKQPIACGSVMAFGGFLDIRFRQHDFFLGRNNARNFFRIYFSFEYDPENNMVHPIHRNWTSDMVQQFRFERDGKTFLPIIPDLYWLKEKLEQQKRNPYSYGVQWPEYNPESLFALRGKLEQRVLHMLELVWKNNTAKQQKAKPGSPETEKWLNHYYMSSRWKEFTSWVGGGILKWGFKMQKKKVAMRIAKKAIGWMLTDLESKGLLKKHP
ncbi:MAG: hypothetical protein JNM68_12310 [Dinghuibacter sp.]|nr:hypothetical protein [Dinghuibacter sp.]